MTDSISNRFACGLVVIIALATAPGAQAVSDQDWNDACASMGIDSGPCACIRQTVTRTHGEEAASAVILDMLLRYDEAEAMRERVGEEKVWAASELFDIAQNGACAPSNYAATMASNEAASASGAAVAGKSADDAAGAPRFVPVTYLAGSQHVVLDFRGVRSPSEVRVKVRIGDEALGNQRPADFRDYVAFYRVADPAGGIDTTGDGVGDLRPGDEGYADAARTQALIGRFLLSDAAGSEQDSGPIRFEEVELASTFIRYNGAANLKGDLYFAIPEANSDGKAHIAFFGGIEDYAFEDTYDDLSDAFNDLRVVVTRVTAAE